MADRRCAAAPPLPHLPPKFVAYLRELGIDPADPAFLAGIRASERAIEAEARWMRALCKPAQSRRG